MTFRSTRSLSFSVLFVIAACCAGCTMLEQIRTGKKSPPPPLPPVVEAVPVPTTPVMPAVVESTTAQVALNQGIALYNDGDYNGAIKKLAPVSQSSAGDKTVQLKALKYMAFSYCVMGRQASCRQDFDKALRLDRSFDLDPGEKGHPLWGPVFQKAKKAAGK